ncbi:cyclic nucleotide-binding domain-containing protein [Methylomarinum vadi]|uniref:cyclic nucleotide-binding domain-containing protein n=1 Tax=Methylomarinum vadi TaxID=438855 RepID=UPI0004DFB088|nr:cyclic nucleotide-binding domain-containing protein [Methylomarinum vadi]
MLNSEHPLSLKSLLDHPEFVEGEFWLRKQYHPEEVVIVEGERGKEIFVILNGQVSVCTKVQISADRHMVSGLCELFDGEEFSHSCFFDDEPHCATVKAISASELAVIDAEKLKQFLLNNPELGFRLLYHWLSIILPRIRQSNKRFSNLLSWGLKAYQIDSSI